MNRMMPIVKEEFQNALRILLATAPNMMQQYLSGDKDLSGIAQRVVAKLKNASDNAAQLHRQHVYEEGDFSKGVCCHCGKVESYRIHISAEEWARRKSAKAETPENHRTLHSLGMCQRLGEGKCEACKNEKDE